MDEKKQADLKAKQAEEKKATRERRRNRRRSHGDSEVRRSRTVRRELFLAHMHLRTYDCPCNTLLHSQCMCALQVKTASSSRDTDKAAALRWKAGDSLEAQTREGGWFTATVVRARGADVLVHYQVGCFFCCFHLSQSTSSDLLCMSSGFP